MHRLNSPHLNWKIKTTAKERVTCFNHSHSIIFILTLIHKQLKLHLQPHGGMHFPSVTKCRENGVECWFSMHFTLLQVLCEAENCAHAGRWNRPTVTREMEKKCRLHLRLMVLMHKYKIYACSPAASCRCCKMSRFHTNNQGVWFNSTAYLQVKLSCVLFTVE